GRVAARDPAVEVVRNDRRGERGAVGEGHALLEVEGPGQSVVRDLVALGEPRHGGAVVIEREQAVEHLVREVGLLDPAAEDARRLLLVRVDDRAALEWLATAGGCAARGAPRAREHRADRTGGRAG